MRNKNIRKKKRKIAVCLLSGGMDSCVAATITKQKGYELYLLSIDYGQVFQRELNSAKQIGRFLNPKKHIFFSMKDFKKLSKSGFTSLKLQSSGVMYPPARDPVNILIASAWLESLMLEYIKNIEDAIVVIGINKYDSLVNPDCGKIVYRKLNEFFKISTKVSWHYKKPFRLETPLIDLQKPEIIKLGIKINAPLHLTWSCYKGKKLACGNCDACRVRLKAFREAHEIDPVKYKINLKKT